MNMNTEVTDIRAEAVAVISEVLGKDTATLYSVYLEKKDVEEVLATLAELLTSYMGEKKAKEITAELYDRYKLSQK